MLTHKVNLPVCVLVTCLFVLFVYLVCLFVLFVCLRVYLGGYELSCIHVYVSPERGLLQAVALSNSTWARWSLTYP